MRRARAVLLVSAACGLVLLAGCAGRGGGAGSTRSAAEPPEPVSLAEARITAAVLLDSDYHGSLAASRRTVSIVGLDGQTTKRTIQRVSPDGYDGLSLSPDGRSLLYPTGSGWSWPNSFSSLRELDLDTGADVAVTTASPVAWGWDATGRVIAVTATHEIGFSTGLPSMGHLTVWRGEAGRMESAIAEAGASPVDIAGFITADAGAAYFGGSTSRGPGGSASILHVWRYDFASHILTSTVTTRSRGRLLRFSPGTAFDDLSAPAFFGGTPNGDLVTGGLRRNHYMVLGRATGGGFAITRNLRSVDVLRPSDMRVLRSVEITPTPAFDPRGYMPLFDSGLAHYIIGIAPPTAYPGGRDTGPARLAEVEIASGKVTFVDAPPSASTDPLGYLGASSAFVYRSAEASRVVVSLKEPGKPSRVILRLGPVSTPVGPLDRPVLLGVQYAR